MTSPLVGIRVVEISEQAFVPSAGAALADLGADVIKVERTTGDPLRQIISSGMVPSAGGFDFLYEIANRNKRNIALDITGSDGRAVLERLVATAHVFLTSQLPQVQRKLRTTPEDIFAIKPDIVFARGHGQGQRGPDAESGGYDGVSYWARGGLSHILSDPEATSPPLQRPALGDLPSGMFLMGGICAALLHTFRTGQGIVVDTSLLNAAIWTLGPDLAYTSLTGQQMQVGAGVRSPLTRVYRTADERFIQLMMINEDRYWDACTKALELPGVGAEFADPGKRREHWGPLAEVFAAAVGRIRYEELERRLVERGCIFSGYATPQDVLNDPAAAANGYLMTHPVNPDLRLGAPPVQFDDAAPVIRRPAPSLGQHSEEILAELGYSAADVDTLTSSGAVTAGVPTTNPA
ncbi:MAG: putative Formyl-CoA transferase [Mycobacterium sp.]|nr:putative Formyl-CoA transferase [Mycobacterium sp.]